MSAFWEYQFTDSPGFVNTFDELPLWSASFGLLLLKHLELKPYDVVLDVGSGAGFPLLELAERLGPGCKCYGIDPWTNANERARKKIADYNVANVEIIETSADKLPFDDDSVDLIVSNLGINNFSDPPAVFKEVRRALKPGGKLALTTNLNGHWKEFYAVFEDTLTELNRTELLAKLQTDQQHRGTVQSISELFANAGLEVTKVAEEPFVMKFLNGTAFLNHHFVKLGWLGSWQSLVPKDDWAWVFSALEQNLNSYSEKVGGLNLTVPAVYMEGVKR